MRRLLLIAIVVLAALSALPAFAQPPDSEAPVESIGLLNLLGLSPADFGIAEPVSSLAERLIADGAVEVALLAALPQYRTPDGAFGLGDPNAPITIIEFADWACPHCQDYHPEIMQVLIDFVVSGQAAFEFRIFPTAGGATTEANGALAVCAEDQTPGGFWSSYVYLYLLAEARQYDTAAVVLPEVLGIDADVLADCAAVEDQVLTDIAAGTNADVRGTPAVLVRRGAAGTPDFLVMDGTIYNSGGVPYDILARAIREVQAQG